MSHSDNSRSDNSRSNGRGNGHSRGNRRSGNGGGRGGGRGNNRHRNNSRRGNNRGGGGNRRGGYRGNRISQVQSGNQRERIQVESGALVLIDQFMLANPQFLELVRERLDDEPEAKNELVERFGGTVVNVQPSTYKIERDPYALTIVIHQEGSDTLEGNVSEQATEQRGEVCIDTRCLAMIDRELLDDIDLLEKYQNLWFSGQDKACRDLLRDNGGAVRYGFQRFGDELGVYVVPGENTVALYPDMTMKSEATAESAEESASA